MASYLIACAILNLIIGIGFIRIGIKKKGKKQFLDNMGYTYIAWVLLSTISMIYAATTF